MTQSSRTMSARPPERRAAPGAASSIRPRRPARAWRRGGGAVAAGTAGLLLAALLAPAGAAAAPGRGRDSLPRRYDARVVEPAGLANGSVAAGINDGLAVIGNTLNDGGGLQRGFLAYRGSTRLLPGAELTRATDIAPDGTVVGATAEGADEPWLLVPVRWARSGARTPLPIAWPADFSFFKNGTATAVNSRLDVVGSAALSYRTGATFRWASTPRPAAPIENSGPGWGLDATDIADSGLAVGYEQSLVPGNPPGSVTRRAVVIDRDRVEVLPRLGSATASDVAAISPNGRYLVGTVDNRPARFTRGRPPVVETAARDLRPADVSDSGVIVGTLPRPGGGTAAAYDRGRLIELSSRTVGLPAGWTLRAAEAVNRHGDIAATALDPHGVSHTVLLDAR